MKPAPTLKLNGGGSQPQINVGALVPTDEEISEFVGSIQSVLDARPNRSAIFQNLLEEPIFAPERARVF